jgi:hypothetical protein
MRRSVWLFVCITTAVLCPTATAEDPAPADLVSILPETSGRLIVWRVGEKQFGTVQPARVSLAKTPNSGKLALGLTHSGYSAEDPDGKNAILTFTVVLDQSPITEDEKTLFAKKGVTLKEDLVVKNPKFTQIDILLRADPEEEKRLRAELKLPRKIGEAMGNQPFSIRWKGVAGPTLYKWLTDPLDGLRVVYKGDDGTAEDVGVAWPLIRMYTVDADKLAAWWQKSAGDKDTYSWRGGTGPLVQSLIEDGVVLLSGKPVPPENAEPEVKLLSEKLKQIATPSLRGVLTVAKKQFLGLAGEGKSSAFLIEGRVNALPSNLPGGELLTHPEYVKDLTGDGKGLAPFKPGKDKEDKRKEKR